MVSVPRVLSAKRMEPMSPKQPESLRQRMLEDRLRDPAFRAKYERLQAEMLEQRAPAIEGPVVNPGRKRRGRLVFGDDTGWPR